ncbi:MAG: NAD-dependent DNA ligase LigA, partial [Halobacteriales archaeon]|nr:NAD-dependent DNA ligase LigA [Halobacteriales archaeon]
MVDAPSDNPYVTDPTLEFSPVEELDETAARNQVAQLREAISYHDQQYYVENDPVIADRAYDVLFDRLQALEDAFDLWDPTSPTNRVGGEPLDELETVEHVREMLSLDSSGEAAEVRAWASRVRDRVGEVTYSVEPKFDGFSVEIVYREGDLERVVTRGNGTEGEDVTENARTIRSLPLSLRSAGDPPAELVVRAEIYMPRSGFQALNEERIERGEDPFANPRNAAAGTVRQLDPGI